MRVPAVLLLLLPASAFAQVANDIDGFATLDANGDGAISREEAAATQSVLAAFADLDTNADGNLDAAEYGATKNPPVAPTAPEGTPVTELPANDLSEPPTVEGAGSLTPDLSPTPQ